MMHNKNMHNPNVNNGCDNERHHNGGHNGHNGYNGNNSHNGHNGHGGHSGHNNNYNRNNGYVNGHGGHNGHNNNYNRNNGYINGRNNNDNNKNYDSNITRQLVNYIYSSVEVSKYKYYVLKTEEDLQMLDVQKCKVSANYTGASCLLLFIKIKDKNYSCLIDRKKLSYNLSQIDYDSLRILNVRVALDQTIYDGSIFDGTYITHGTKKTFVISDCYRFRGNDMTHDQLPIKLLNIKSYMDATYKTNNIINTIDLCINKIYELGETEKLITTEIPKAKNMQIRGLVFHPTLSGTKLIFLFNNNQTNGTDNNNYAYINLNKNKNDNKNDNKKQISYICKTKDEIFVTLEIKNTSIIDVYKLYAVEEITNNDKLNKKVIYKIKKLGIAYIPTKDCSHMCRSLFLDISVIPDVKTRILVKCKFDQNKSKWIPVEKETIQRRPSSVEEIEKFMDVIEDTNSDSE